MAQLEQQPWCRKESLLPLGPMQAEMPAQIVLPRMARCSLIHLCLAEPDREADAGADHSGQCWHQLALEGPTLSLSPHAPPCTIAALSS